METALWVLVVLSAANLVAMMWVIRSIADHDQHFIDSIQKLLNSLEKESG